MATANVTKIDFYEVLQVSRTASDQELKASYRKLAMQYHPDRNPNNPAAEEKFKECSEAYGVLSDPEKRAAYDRYGHAAFQGGGPGGGNPFAGGNAQDLGDIFGDLFGEMFNMGGQRKSSRVQRGRDLRYDLTLEFEDAVFGKEREITIRRTETCVECKGSGAAKGKAPVTCTQCGGRGQLRMQQGFFSVARTCPQCQGTGTLVQDPCKTCNGQTVTQKEHTIQVKVPAGVEQDTRIRYQGEGEAGKFGGPPGDLYVVLNVKAHKFFERDGDDLHCVMPISFPQAALGTELDIETLYGVDTIKIPEGTQSGREFKLRDKGVPHLNERGRGDLIVEVRVQTPAKLSKVQKELLRQLEETMGVENTPHSRGLFDKVKDMFSLVRRGGGVERPMTMVGLLVRGAVAAGLLVGMGWGQAPAPSPAPAQTPDGQGGDYTLRTQANVVLMPTQVETKHGDMLYTLKADQLVVEDNGVRQTIRLDEDTDSLGLSLVVVVQCSRSALMQFNSMRGLGTMIDEITGDAPREVAIVLYGTDIETLGDFSGDPQKLQLALNDVVPCEDESKAVTLDAVDYATKMLEKRNNHYRHAVLLIGETRDHGSKMRPEQVIASLGRTNTVVDSVSFNPGKTDVLNSLIHGQMGPGPMGLLIAAVEAMRKNVPKELSGLSGGEYINFTTQKGFDAGMGRLSNHIHNYYLLSFQPGAVSGDAGATAPGLHRLTVKIPDYPDAKIRSRESYWAGSLDVPVVSGDEKDQ